MLRGAFVEWSEEKYAAKCPSCYKMNPKMIEQNTVNPKVSPIFDKKVLLSSVLALNSRT